MIGKYLKVGDQEIYILVSKVNDWGYHEFGCKTDLDGLTTIGELCISDEYNFVEITPRQFLEKSFEILEMLLNIQKGLMLDNTLAEIHKTNPEVSKDEMISVFEQLATNKERSDDGNK